MKTESRNKRQSVDAPSNRSTHILLFAWCATALLYFRAFAVAHSSDRFVAAQSGTGYSLTWWLIPDELWNAWTSGGSILPAFAERIPIVAVAALILLVSCVLGLSVLSAARVLSRLTNLETFVFSASLGLNVVSTLTFLVGCLGWLHSPAWGQGVFMALFALALAWLYVSRHAKGRVARPQPVTEATRRERHLAETLLIGMGCFFAIVILLGAMLPPWDFDVREYHLQAPKEWYQHGQITFLPHNVYANMPLGAEMHALLAMMLMPGKDGWWWGALTGKLLMACMAPLTALSLLAAGRRFCSPLVGAVAFVVYLSTPWIAHVSMQGLNDAALGHYLWMSVFAVLIWRDGRERSPEANFEESGRRLDQWAFLLLSGYFAGAAAACKYTAVAFLSVPLLLYVVAAFVADTKNSKKTHSWRFLAATVLILGTGIGVGGGGWYMKNAALAQNPTYPMFVRSFGGRTRTPEKDEQWRQAHRVPENSRGERYSLQQAAESIANLGWRSLRLSPLIWPFVLAAFLNRRSRRFVSALLWFLLFYLAGWWLLTHRIERFWVPILPLAAMLAGCGAHWSESKLWRGITCFIISIGFLFLWPLVSTGLPIRCDYRWLTPLSDLRQDQAASPIPPAHRYLNEHVTDGSTVLLVGDAEPFDLFMPNIYNTCFDDCQFERLFRDKSTQQTLHELHRLNISHVYVHWAAIDRYRSPGNYGYSDFVTRRLIQDLVVKRGILRPVTVPGLEAEQGQLFTVRQKLGKSHQLDKSHPARSQ